MTSVKMPLVKRSARMLAFLFGGLGVLGCLAAVIGIWYVDDRLCETTVALTDRLDGSLDRVHDGIDHATQRLDASKLRANDFQVALKNWSTLQATEQVRVRLNVDERVEQLGTVVQQANAWLESATASVEVVKQTIMLANTAGRDIQTKPVETLLSELSALQTQVQEIRQFVDDFQSQAGQEETDAALQGYLERARQLALRILASLDVVQSRLAGFDAKVSNAQLYMQDVEERTLRWIHIVTITCAVLVLWVLAGQVALFRLGWASRAGRDS